MQRLAATRPKDKDLSKGYRQEQMITTRANNNDKSK